MKSCSLFLSGIFLLPAILFAQNPNPLPSGEADKKLPPGMVNNRLKNVCQEEMRLQKAGLVDVQTIDKSILVELKYSTTDNFVGVDVYGCIQRCFLQKKPAQQLAQASASLQKKRPELRLLVYDGARSRRVQQVLWDTLKKPLSEKNQYVADPQKGSIHNYGCAVDLTLATADGKPLDMGTPFDFFGEPAYPVKEKEMLKSGKLTQNQLNNRLLLRSAMQEAGFEPILTEWWHFNALSLPKAKARYGIIE
jgi:zinc D-Ala-D-Ala dipeptidase